MVNLGVALWLLLLQLPLLLQLNCGVHATASEDDSQFPFPPTKHALYVQDSSAIQALLLDPVIHSQSIVAVVTYSIGDDSYLSLYLGGIMDLFEDADKPPLFLIFEQPKELIADATALLFSLLPLNSVFVCIQHGSAALSLGSLELVAERAGRRPRVIYHMNHERPWSHNPNDTLDYLFSDIDQLLDVYGKYDLVLRNYYYEPLADKTVYVPVGPSYYRFHLGEPSLVDPQDSFRVPASQRPIRCYFRGRLDYDTKSRGVSIADQEHVEIRRQLIRLHQEGLAGNCIIESYDPMNDTHLRGKEKYEEYIYKMKDVAIALSPIGNNPETFRFYEAMEVGAIPVLSRTKFFERDYFSHPLWLDYPGPILDDWAELPAFLDSMTDVKMDLLQRKLQAWYRGFRLSFLSDVRQRVRQVFEKYRLQIEVDFQSIRARHSPIPVEWNGLLVTHIFGTEGHRIAVSDLSALLAAELRERSMNEAAPSFGVSSDGRTVHRPRAKSPASSGATATSILPKANGQEKNSSSGTSPSTPSQQKGPTNRVEDLERVVKSLLVEMVILQERVEALELRCNSTEKK